MLPVHNPPAIERPLPTKKVTDPECTVARHLMNDTWLYDTTAELQLGRITNQEIVGLNTNRITTNMGVYLVSPQMVIMRGNINRQSIYSHNVVIQTHMT
eukprot:4443175-Prymnesium_polylepis.2